MPLSASEKQELVSRYMPLLLVSSDDIGLPVDPRIFVKTCALWSGLRPQLDDKVGWGTSGGSGQRLPLVQRGSLSADTLPLSQDHEPWTDEFWLDCAGWLSAAEVGPSEDNRQSNLPALEQMFPGSGEGPTVRAEVCNHESWSEIAGATSTVKVLGLEAESLAETLVDVVIVNYTFLFAAHKEDAVEIFGDDTKYGAGDFEGDWACLSIAFSGASGGRVDALTPRHAAFWRAFRGQSSSFGENGTHAGFEVVPWNAAPKIGNAVCAVAATGTHNLYPADVPATQGGTIDIQSGSLGFVDNLTDDVNSWVKKAVKKNTHTAATVLGVTLAKMAAGAAILGPIGALGGLIAGIAEAKPISKAIGKDPGPPEVDPTTTTPPDGKLKDPKEKFKSKSTQPQNYVLVSSDPAGILDSDIAQFLTFDAVIETRKAWSAESFEPIDRSAEPFWPLHDGTRSKGYVGRWGVRCENDPFNRRAGDILPDYRVEVLRSLMQHIA